MLKQAYSLYFNPFSHCALLFEYISLFVTSSFILFLTRLKPDMTGHDQNTTTLITHYNFGLLIRHLEVFKEVSTGYRWGGAVASWLVRSSPDRAVRVRALAGDIVLCSWAKHFTLTVPLSTQVYKWVPANLMLGVTLRWTSIPSRGE